MQEGCSQEEDSDKAQVDFASDVDGHDWYADKKGEHT